MRTKPTMYKRMLRSALAVVFSAVAVFGAISAVDTDAGSARASYDTGWTSAPAGTSFDTGWTSAPVLKNDLKDDTGWTDAPQGTGGDTGWTSQPEAVAS
ncbi:hypothetical protein OHS33_17255 [Streptomyces sp. NBC_00536]|uniref:hypothetical protein n=1 Tax=Streptomyces sp. NBC_00536 TaxID=2975769 RepID=UPI002E7FB54D|nr:hypothetical protein [Streptomyces sp. NBC_00536]WUC79930.1 hypothetical protein OHS33_17255 [Streptomyces sp. NBC_00536]